MRTAARPTATPMAWRTPSTNAPGHRPAPRWTRLAAPSPAAIVLTGVTFLSGSAKLTLNSQGPLNRAVQELQARPDTALGDRRPHGQRWESARPTSACPRRGPMRCVPYFVSKGVTASRLTTVGIGPDQPVGPNDPADGRARNRRCSCGRSRRQSLPNFATRQVLPFWCSTKPSGRKVICASTAFRKNVESESAKIPKRRCPVACRYRLCASAAHSDVECRRQLVHPRCSAATRASPRRLRCACAAGVRSGNVSSSRWNPMSSTLALRLESTTTPTRRTGSNPANER